MTATQTVTSQGGTITTVGTKTTNYKIIGNTVFTDLYTVITTIGTATGYCRITIPFTASISSIFNGRENSVSGKAIQGRASSTTAYVDTWLYDGTTPMATGAEIYVSGKFSI